MSIKENMLLAEFLGWKEQTDQLIKSVYEACVEFVKKYNNE